MLPELGQFAIILALCFALIQGVVPLWKKQNFQLCMDAVFGQFLFLAFGMLCLILSFVHNDLTVIYVREHSHHLLPLMYRIGAAWGGHEGSLLLWCLILSGWTFAFALFASKALSRKMITNVIMVLGWVNAGFIVFLFATSNPFWREFPTGPIVGNDLTPVLQDPGLIFHPPMLYLGYVGFAIVFAFALCALFEGKFDKVTARACRPWIILPWSFLSCGIVLGSWWAYRELGWGGWWFWDPVENASLLPWLSATALLHSLIVSEKRGAFQGWTILLAIITFGLCLLGTFLVRSGVIVSVHAFANDPQRGVYLLIYLAVIIGVALFCYGYKIKQFYRAPTFNLISRETLLLINSVFLTIAVVTIIIGTLYPIILDALNLEKISVGEPYFNTVFVPLMLPLLLLMGVAPHTKWGSQTLKQLWVKLRLTIVLSITVGFLAPVLAGFPFHFWAGVGTAVGLWIIFATLQYAFQGSQEATQKAVDKEASSSSVQHTLSRASMIVAHIGIAILVLGITLNKSYSEERQVKIKIGETVSLAGYQFTFKNLAEMPGPNYQSLTASFSVQHKKNTPTILTSEQRIYSSHDQTMSKAGILVNMWRDIYLSMGAPLSDQAWSVRVYYKPFVRWIWFGGLLLLVGGGLSLLSYMTKRR
jgi:cytochrome c-type biogenesis protein CcmF